MNSSRHHGLDTKTNGAPPAAAAVLYDGQVMHQRMKPVGHRFNYKVFSLMLDVDRLPEAGRLARLFSVNGFNLLSFHESDHTGSPERSLREHVDALLAEAGLDERAARVLLVCYPRILGLVFNPIAIYHAYGHDGGLIATVYEVRNTFGERHTYVCPVLPGELSPAGLRQQCDKIFHVSPFITMAMRYHFRLLPPGQEIRWRILETDAEGPLLAATFSGHQRPLSSATILKLTARMPHLTLKILAGIHWEALKLWVKGVRYIPRPALPDAVSVWVGGKRRARETHSNVSAVGEAAE